jgi:hypothetical protein
MQEAEIELLKQTFSGLMYVGDIPGFVKNMGTTIYGITAQYWKSVVVGFENRLVSPGLTLPQRKTGRCIVLWDENFLTEQLYRHCCIKLSVKSD